MLIDETITYDNKNGMPFITINNMGNDSDLTYKGLEQIIAGYFRGLVDEIFFRIEEHDLTLVFEGRRGLSCFFYSFDLFEWDSYVKSNFEYHALEHIKGLLLSPNQKFIKIPKK